MRHTLFISDLHLEPDRPDMTQCLLNFLKQQAPQADALYILGDFFEVWIGDDQKSTFHETIIAALRQLTAFGFPVYFMHGNRDFLIGERFMKATGCHFLTDPTIIELYGKRVLLAHGDSLCSADVRHQRFRKYARNPRYNRLFLWLPLWLRKLIARQIRNLSKRHTTNMSDQIMDVVLQTVEEVMRQHQVTQLIHGHTHRPAMHRFVLDKTPACRVVLSDWHAHGSALVYYENQEMEFICFPF